jgi:predicted amidohydrolase
MKRIVRISAVQLPAFPEGKTFAERQARNIRSIREMLWTAGERRSDLVLFGEYANLSHRTWSSNRREYVRDPVPGPLTRLIGRAARGYRMNVAFPLFGTWNGELSSFVVLFDRKGKITGCYQKTHPTEAEQKAGIRPGTDLPVFDLDCARIGIMTCMDIEYPEVAQVLMLRGAEILLFPHVQGSWGEVDWEIRYRARAIDTGLYAVSACYGYENGQWLPGKMIGRTSVIGRDGLVIADIGRSIGVLTVDVDLSQRRVTQFYFDRALDRTLAVTASRRPELYGDLTDTSYTARAFRKIRPGRTRG